MWFTELSRFPLSFGGELIVNGDIFYSDGIQKERIIYAFSDPTEPEIHSPYPAKEYGLLKLINIQIDATGDSGELVTIMLTAATKWERSEVRKHILGLTALLVSQITKEERDEVRAGL